MKGLFITGTDTNVGKTHIACMIARQLHLSGTQVCPRKPIESGCTRLNNELIPADAKALKEAASYTGSLAQVCPFRFEPAISPLRAAQLAGQKLITADVARHCKANVNEKEFLLLEGAGGFYSPLCEDGLNADLAEAMKLPVLLVAEDKLGCINHILLSLEAIKTRGLKVFMIILNQTRPATDDLMDNFQDLSQILDIPLGQVHFQQTVFSKPIKFNN